MLFVERAVVYNICTDQTVPVDLSDDEKSLLTANLFYGFSRDAKELVMCTTKKRVGNNSAPLVKDNIMKFAVHAASELTPDYSRLRLEEKDTSDWHFDR